MQSAHEDIIQFFDEVVTSSQHNHGALDEFKSRKTARVVSVVQLLKHLKNSLELDEVVITTALVLFKRIAANDYRITPGLVNKLITACLLLTEKMYSDEETCFEGFSLATGMSKKELKRLELRLLEILDFNILVPPREYHQLPTAYFLSLCI